MNISPLIEQLKQKNFRITKARRHLLQALSEGPLTMMELAQYMRDLGHPNVQTIYNNIHTLEKEHIIFTTLKDHTKYYHLVADLILNILIFVDT